MCFCLWSSPRRQPPSPPFPYTTLFRSPVGLAVLAQIVMIEARPIALRTVEFFVAGGLLSLLGWRVVLAESEREDRKSTRLNSSHVSTSYAVFRLKKKRINSMTSWRPYS